MEYIVPEENAFTDKLKVQGHTIIVDPAAVKVMLNRKAVSASKMRVGKFHFFDDLEYETHLTTGTPYFTATAAVILEIDGEWYATVDKYNVSNLVSPRSFLLNVFSYQKGSHLYLYQPFEDLMDRKKSYISEFIMGFAIEVIKEMATNEVEWRFIQPKEFTDFPEELQEAAAFTEYRNKKIYELIRPDSEIGNDYDLKF